MVVGIIVIVTGIVALAHGRPQIPVTLERDFFTCPTARSRTRSSASRWLRAATFLLAVTGATGCGGVLDTRDFTVPQRPRDRAFAATMEAHTNSPVIGGNVIDVLLNGDAIFPAKLAAIRAASTTINYAEYFYAEGQSPRRSRRRWPSVVALA